MMSNVWTYSLVSALIVSLISLVGVVFLSLHEDTLKSALLFLVSFSVGALFGDVFIHLLPEVLEKSGFGLNISMFLLSGILTFFILEKFIEWRHCHIPTSKEHPHSFATMNLIGDGVHNLIDGMIIGGSFLASTTVGVATTVAVILHEIPQEIGDFGVLLHGGYSKKEALLLNFLSAVLAIIGVVISLAVGSKIENFSTFLIPFAAGGFIYIAGSDLIPELHKETSATKSFFEFLSLLAGIGVMVLLTLL